MKIKDTVSIHVQDFFDNNNIFILKEIGIVIEKDPNLNKSLLICQIQNLEGLQFG